MPQEFQSHLSHVLPLSLLHSAVVVHVFLVHIMSKHYIPLSLSFVHK